MIRLIDKFLSSQVTIVLFVISFICMGIVPLAGLAGINFMHEYYPYSVIVLMPFFIVVPLMILRIFYGLYWMTKLIGKIKNNPELNSWDFMKESIRAFSVKDFSKRFSIPVRATFIILEMMERFGQMEKFYLSKGISYEYKMEIPEGQGFVAYYRPVSENEEDK